MSEPGVKIIPKDDTSEASVSFMPLFKGLVMMPGLNDDAVDNVNPVKVQTVEEALGAFKPRVEVVPELMAGLNTPCEPVVYNFRSLEDFAEEKLISNNPVLMELYWRKELLQRIVDDFSNPPRSIEKLGDNAAYRREVRDAISSLLEILGKDEA